MKPSNLMYWGRVSFGVVAAILCVMLSIDTLLQGASIGIFMYLVTYYIFKWLFITKIEKTSQLFMTGIGGYFFTWIVAWGLFHTLVNI